MDESTRANTPPTEDSRAPTVVGSSYIDEKDSLHKATEAEPAVEHTPLESGSVKESYTQQGQQNLPGQQNEESLDTTAAAHNELKQVQTREEGAVYPTGIKLALISLALCLSVFLMALDNTIIAVAIPKITDEFNSLGDVGWYGSAYLLTTASFQLLFGKFYSFFSIKTIFLIAISIFEIGSLVCGVAPNSSALIVGRAIAGVGSAGIFSGAMIIIAYSVPLQKRPMFTSMIGAMYGISSVAGPLLGGVFTDKATWRWCFYINLPLGAITLVVIGIFFTAPDRATSQHVTFKDRVNQLDLLGTAIFIPSIVCLLLALQWGGSDYPWSDARIIALFVVFGVLIIAFLGVQIWKGENATVPLRIIKKRTIWASCWFSFCLGASFFIVIYYLPIWFQAVQGVSAVQSGIRSIPLVLGLVILSVISGVGVSVFGYFTPFMIAGSVVSAIGYGFLSTLTPSSSSGMWIGFTALAGIGVGLGMQQPMMGVQTVLDIKDVPTGTAVLIFIQTLGGALFVSVGQNAFTNKLISGLAQYAPQVDPNLVRGVGATSIQSSPALAPYLAGVTLAYSDALTLTFKISAGMAAASIIGSAAAEWKSVKGKKIEPGLA